MRFAVVLSLVALVGCGQTETSLTGLVKVDGEPMPRVLVVVNASDGKTASGSSDASGRYTVEKPPEGNVRIQVIDPPGNSPNPRPGLAFSAPKGSGVEYTVKPGPQTFDIEISTKPAKGSPEAK